eukprot:m.94941 g.94941  ORF g.94941 m.94941 type:complete len:420 (-) comp13470_c0_seq1:3485-4744(-)
MSSTIPFTCLTCRVGFRTADAQRNHYKTDWHRYNLKRKMAEMAPVSAAEFRSLLQTRQEKAEAEQAANENATSSFTCEPCNKRFNSVNAYENHLNSKKCITIRKKIQDGQVNLTDKKSPTASKPHNPTQPKPKPTNEDTELDQSDDNLDEEPERTLTLEDCIFCSHKSDSLEENIKHMALKHGFFVPDFEFCVDLSALIAYLQTKVECYHMCLLCNGRGKGFYSMEAARGHMIDKGHCFVDYEEEGQLELEEFYDFRSSYPADARPMDTGEDDEGDWEDVDDDDDDGDTMGEVAEEDIVDLDEQKERQLALNYRSERRVEVDGLDLVLPSGARLGHRSLRKYYKQRFATNDNRDSVVIQKLVSEYMAIGLPSIGTTVATKAARRDRDVHRRQAMDSRMKLGVHQNKSAMNKHFREQMMQ